MGVAVVGRAVDEEKAGHTLLFSLDPQHTGESLGCGAVLTRSSSEKQSNVSVKNTLSEAAVSFNSSMSCGRVILHPPLLFHYLYTGNINLDSIIKKVALTFF